MSAHAGERAEATGTFVCQVCGETVRIHQGEKIPTCPSCGSRHFAVRSADRNDPRPPRSDDQAPRR
jgi:DNA-directed RNA polymerase subunit RPC12/RpoP